MSPGRMNFLEKIIMYLPNYQQLDVKNLKIIPERFFAKYGTAWKWKGFWAILLNSRKQVGIQT